MALYKCHILSIFGGSMKFSSSVRLLAIALGLVPGIVLADWQLNLTPSSTLLGADIKALHDMTMWVIVGISVVVFGAMFWSILKHRKSVGHKASNFHENTTVEIVWTVIPVVILSLIHI